MIRLSIFAILTLIIFAHCNNSVPKVNLVGSQDPDIVLVNIENGDREFIGKILLKLDSLDPIVIGINVFFEGKKTRREDSILAKAMQKIDNVILPYGLSIKNEIEASDSIFMRFAKDKGLLKYIRTTGLISNMIPLPKIEDKVHESFAYKIVKYWKPDIKPNFEINQQIPINYQRTSEMFMRLDGSFLLETNIDDYDLKNKVFLLGYSGPGKEDKYSTPLRFTGKEPEHDEPDTYGLVIIANQLRTIIDYNK